MCDVIDPQVNVGRRRDVRRRPGAGARPGPEGPPRRLDRLDSQPRLSRGVVAVYRLGVPARKVSSASGLRMACWRSSSSSTVSTVESRRRTGICWLISSQASTARCGVPSCRARARSCGGSSVHEAAGKDYETWRRVPSSERWKRAAWTVGRGSGALEGGGGLRGKGLVGGFWDRQGGQRRRRGEGGNIGGGRRMGAGGRGAAGRGGLKIEGGGRGARGGNRGAGVGGCERGGKVGKGGGVTTATCSSEVFAVRGRGGGERGGGGQRGGGMGGGMPKGRWGGTADRGRAQLKGELGACVVEGEGGGGKGAPTHVIVPEGTEKGGGIGGRGGRGDGVVAHQAVLGR